MSKSELKSLFGVLFLLLLISAGAEFGLSSYKSYLKRNVEDISFNTSQNFPDFRPLVSSGSIKLFDHFIMSAPITPENIRQYSYRIQEEGKVATATLHVEASPTGFGTDKTRIHTVYFYIDDGRTGGHLASRRENTRIVEGGFKIGDPPYVLDLDFANFSVARGIDEKIDIHPLQILNDGQPHWIGAFVATGIYGSLDNLEIRYTCENGSPCKINLVQ
ncbi:MAG: hypothetical protein Q7S29_01960 [Candidatus Peribacter sp.]|nr:hypothetical protein [Candidatus Peribacter sp.]